MKKILLITSLFAIFVFVSRQTFAQNAAPQVLLTWKAHTYVPQGFAGKVLPTANSAVTASVELVDGGKIADLSAQNVYWYQDGDFIAGGLGLQRITFRTPAIPSGTTSIRVEIPNYQKGDQFKTVDIPIVRPKAVIELPFPSGKFSSSPLKLSGQPYFFNASSPSTLSFSWSVNGQTPSGAENPQALSVKFDSAIPNGSVFSVSLSIQNTDSRYDIETASQNANLIYSP